MTTKVLYVEDEPFLGKIVFESLVAEGFDVVWKTDGAAALESLTDFHPDLCVIDVMLPTLDGFSLCRHIRSLWPVLPVIFLTARTEIPDLVEGFNSGGTDYIRKPFSLEELLLRIKNQLSMSNGWKAGNPVENTETGIGLYRFYPHRYELLTPTHLIRLSQREKQVLSLLVANMGRITDRKEMLLAVWGDDSFFNSRNLDVYIRKLRAYLREDPAIRILTLKGKGYLMTVEPQENHS